MFSFSFVHMVNKKSHLSLPLIENNFLYIGKMASCQNGVASNFQQKLEICFETPCLVESCVKHQEYLQFPFQIGKKGIFSSSETKTKVVKLFFSVTDARTLKAEVFFLMQVGRVFFSSLLLILRHNKLARLPLESIFCG